VIVEILVAQRQRENALPEQIRDGVFDEIAIAVIDEALGRPSQQPDRLFGLVQQQRPRRQNACPAS